MPDDKGLLSAEDAAKCFKWINDHQPGDVTCAICGTTKWSIAAHVVEVRASTRAAVTIGAPTYPLFQMICSNCGHTLFVNAIIAGVIGPSSSKSSTEEKNG